MEQPPNIDQFFRERLQHTETPPPAFVWPRVEEELRRRRRRFFLWLWLGIGLAGAGLWGMWRLNSSDVTTLAALPQVVQEKTSNPIQLSQPAPEKNIPTATLPYSSNSREIRKESGTGDQVNAQMLRSGKKGPEFTREKTPSDHSTPTPSTILSAFSSPKGGSVPAMGGVFPLAYSATPLGFLPIVESDLVPPTQSLILPKAKPFFFKKKKSGKNCYDFNQHPRVWLLDAYAGPSLPQRQLAATQSEFNDYLQQRRNTEESSWAFNAGLRGSLLFGQHFLLRVGAHYEQMTEVFAYGDPNYKKVNVAYITKIVDGVLVNIIDTVSVEYGEHYIKTYNRFGMLEIPLMAGAEFRAGRAGLSLQAGTSLNVLFWKHGTILNAQGTPESFTPGQEDASPVFRRRAGWSATASAQLFYHVRSRLRIFAEPYYSRPFRALTLANQPITQRYTTWGLKIGATKIFD